MGKMSLAKEFIEYTKVKKKYWLVPIILVLFLLGALIIFTESSALSPFIYALF